MCKRPVARCHFNAGFPVCTYAPIWEFKGKWDFEMAVETVEYRVRRGESLQDIVQANGFPRRDWRRIYDASYNRAFRTLRPDPDSIQPGDRLMLPRLNPAQIAEIVLRIQIAERRFLMINDEIRNFERDIAQMERTIAELQDTSERKVQQRIAAIRRRADTLLDISASAADECTDAYTCLGAGTASTRFEMRARRLRTEANNLQRSVSRGERDAIQAMRTLNSRLTEFTRAQAGTARSISQLRSVYRRAAQNPY